MKTSFRALALACAVLGGATAFAQTPLHILPIGDSITAGGRAGAKEYTYRFPLERMLRDENACVDFVGGHRGGLDPQATWPAGADTYNEGFYGAKTAEVRDRLAADLDRFPPPDIALIHLGTNDAAGFVENDIVDPLKQIIAMLRARNPKVVVLLAEINGPTDFRTAYLQARIDEMALRLSTPESRIVAVDQHTGWNIATDTSDGVHPNLKGQRKMAERWLDAMQPFLRVDPANC